MFEPLLKPEGEHVVRTSLYHRMLELDSSIRREIDDTFTVLYVNKGVSKSSPYKEYHVSVAPQSRQVDALLETAREVADFARE